MDTSHLVALEGWEGSNSAPNCNPELSFLRQLRVGYSPEKYHITQISSKKCDLMGYAEAGHAVAVRQDTRANYSVRAFDAPSFRLQEKQGGLTDEVTFGRWTYTWGEKEYMVYQIKYQLPFRSPSVKLFIIAPQTTNDYDAEDHHSETDALLLAVGSWTSQLHDEIYVYDDEEWTKDKALFKSIQSASWDDVILNREMKEALVADVQGFFENQSLYKKLRVPWKRGIILHGVPGNGKTISIKALINYLHQRPDPVPSLYVKSFDGTCHQPKWSIREIFGHARKMAPCLLIFEDLDSLITPKTRAYFLNEVDGLESNDGILMVGSTNYLSKLDPSISQRPSRFDRKYHFNLPNAAEREAYCAFWRRKLLDSDMVDFAEGLGPIIAQMTDGFSFAYLKELFLGSLLAIADGTAGGSEELDAGSAHATDDGIVVEKEETAEDPTGGGGAATTEKATPTKKVLPEVEIPAHLKENILLRTITLQAKMLLDEMGRTDEEAAQTKADDATED